MFETRTARRLSYRNYKSNGHNYALREDVEAGRVFQDRMLPSPAAPGGKSTFQVPT